MRAIKKLKAMGNGFGMIPVGGSYLVQSVPAELNMDHTVVFQLAEVIFHFTNGVCFDHFSQLTDIEMYLIVCWPNLTTSSVAFSVYLQKKGYVTVSEIKDNLKWERERACHVLVSFLKTASGKDCNGFRQNLFSLMFHNAHCTFHLS